MQKELRKSGKQWNTYFGNQKGKKFMIKLE